MDNRIELLSVDIIKENRDLFRFMDYWKKVLNLEIGWHYDLDLVWILAQIEQMNLSPGAVIMDAGAGNGLMQFLLAARGYQVVSVDFSERDIPVLAAKILDVSETRHQNGIEPHRYHEFIDHKRAAGRRLLSSLTRVFTDPARVIHGLASVLRPYFFYGFWRERLSGKRAHGTVNYVRADIADLSLFDDNIFDCVVSVSAIEHCDHEHIKKGIREFERVLKKGAEMVITTSAAKNDDWYFKECEGWCFAFQSLKDLFGLDECFQNYNDYDSIFKKLKEDKLLKSRISKIYFSSGDNGLPWGEYNPRYQPVGIRKKTC